LGAVRIVPLRITAERDQADVLQGRGGLEQSRQLEPAHVGQADIQQRNRRSELASDSQCFLPAVRHAGTVTLHAQDLSQHLR
jgi:hypothetical protein